MYLEMPIVSAINSGLDWRALYAVCILAVFIVPFWWERYGNNWRHRRERRRKESLPRLRAKRYKDSIALVREDDYLEVCREYEEKARRGEIKPWEKMVVIVQRTFTFYVHEADKTLMHVGGFDKYHSLIGEFYPREQRSEPEDAPNLFLPFLNETIMKFEEQAKMFKRYSLEEVRNYLLTKQLPQLP